MDVHAGTGTDRAEEQARLQTLEVEVRVLRERLCTAESACQLARLQADELAQSTAQDAATLQDKLAEQKVQECPCLSCLLSFLLGTVAVVLLSFPA